MRPNELDNIRTGDIVLVRDYPNVHDLKAGSVATKDRFAVVIGNFKEGFFSAPAQSITTKGRRTERPDYRLKENEVRLPEHILDKRADFNLTGVIKAHRFPLVSQDQMSYKVGRLPLETRLNLVSVHDQIKNSPRQIAEMKAENPHYAKIMNYFKELTVAEKMNFMQDPKGNQLYEFQRNKVYKVTAAQLLSQSPNLNHISIRLEGNGKEFVHTFATRKSLEEVQKEWKKPKMAKDWIREDMKFHVLQKNPLAAPRPDPTPHPDKYKPLNKLIEPTHKQGISAKRNNGLQL